MDKKLVCSNCNNELEYNSDTKYQYDCAECNTKGSLEKVSNKQEKSQNKVGFVSADDGEVIPSGNICSREGEVTIVPGNSSNLNMSENSYPTNETAEVVINGEVKKEGARQIRDLLNDDST